MKIKRTAFACWLLSAALLTLGYSANPAVARSPARHTHRASSGKQHSPSPPATRGAVISVTPLGHLSAAAVKHLAKEELGIETAQPRYAVAAYRVLYATVNREGQPTRASGLLVLPQNESSTLRVIDYEHGTTVFKQLAPSTSSEADARIIALLDASAGFGAVAPDYLGMGAGPGPVAYLDVSSEVTASLDMLRAARAVASNRHRTLDPRVFVSGFSQGGPAALGLARALEAGVDPSFSLAALTGASGVYDLQGSEIPAILSGALDPTWSNFNLIYFSLTWERSYHIYAHADEVFQPGTAHLRELFNGQHTEREIFEALPHTLTAVFRPSYLERLAHPDGTLLNALTMNDNTCEWHPAAPVRLYAASGDHVVTIANSRHCQQQISEQGGNVSLVDLGDVEHLASAAVAAPLALSWFEEQSQ